MTASSAVLVIDWLDGGYGVDLIVGGSGHDDLTGGADADTFTFAWGDGWDAIKDFEIGVDTVDLGALGLSEYGFDGLNFYEADYGAVLVLNEEQSITFEGVHADALNAYDFIL